MILRLIPLVIASLLIAAHFARKGSLELLVISLLLPLLLLVKKRWSLIIVQIGAYAAAAVWLFTAVHLVMERTYLGRSWTVAVIILGSVTLFTILAGVLLNSNTVKERYPSRQRDMLTPEEASEPDRKA